MSSEQRLADTPVDSAPSYKTSTNAGRWRLLYIDMAYTYEMVKEKKHFEFFEMRHSGSYFSHVWGVHPLADVAGKPSHQIETIRFSDRQRIIEGVSQSRNWPKLLLPLNFLISQFKLVLLLRRLIRDERIDLIHATDAFYSGLFGWILKRLTGRRLVVAVYANQDELYEATGALAMPRLLPFRWLEKLVCGFVLRRADLVIAPNRNNLDYAFRNGAVGPAEVISNAKNVEPTHLAAPEHRAVPLKTFERIGVQPCDQCMLLVGRLLELKHPDEAVRAMAIAIRAVPGAIGLLAGDGPMRETLEQLIEQEQMTGRIHFLGHVDQHELARLIPHCIILSPLTGMALIECGLGGAPLIVFDRDWQAEFVEDEVNGYVVPFLDHAAMASKAIQLLREPALRLRLGRHARERALELADSARIQAREHAAYDRLLAGAVSK